MSYKVGDEVHIEDDDASAGTKTGHVRWILGISLFAAVAILAAIWIFGAISQSDVENESTRASTEQETPAEAMDTDPVLTDADNDPAGLDTPQDDTVNGVEVVE